MWIAKIHPTSTTIKWQHITDDYAIQLHYTVIS
jgi:hypothetical protein